MTAKLHQPAHKAEYPRRSRGRLARLALGAPEDPGWARPGLWVVLILAGFLYAWDLSRNGDANAFYAAAVLSGTESWKAFFYGSLDPASFITVDKPPFAFWAMGISARIFGFNSWSLLLPQAAEGVAAVAVVYAAVRRSVAGLTGERGAQAAALIAALVLTLTPITVAINRDDNPDTMLTLLLALGAWALLESLRSRRPVLMLSLSGLAFGLAFNTKMLEGFIALPAIPLVYLIAADGRLRKRIGRMLPAGAVLAVVTLSWMTIVDLIPKSSRPFVGGSANDTVWNLVIAYNGVGRVLGKGKGGRGLASLGRVFGTAFGGQISWLIPFAILAAIALIILIGRRSRTDLARASVLLWAAWLILEIVVLGIQHGIQHAYYASAMSPPIAALTGIGAVALCQAAHRSARWRWVLPALVAITGGWAFALLLRTPAWNAWLPAVVAAATVVTVVVLLAGRQRRALLVLAGITGLVAILAGPAAYAVTPLSKAIAGGNPLAGPAAGTGGGRSSAVSKQLIAYLEAHRGGATWLVAVRGSSAAAAIILETGGTPVMAMGGYTGSDPAPTLSQLRQYISQGRLHYVLAGGRGRRTGGTALVNPWVKQNCTVVSPSAYGASASTGAARGGPDLYRCG